MSLTAGRSLLHYRLDAPLGQGGMGVVWRAHDNSLGRDVALKFLPEVLAGDPERMARLEREARLLASLNHPHVASIYGFHQADGARFLAMELVEGEDLSQRLARGPIPVPEALPMALQIAEALEHAHEKGVIHRDLKPANVKLAESGAIKVLDFGLAKAIEGDPASARSGSALSHSPTITGGMTGANVLLGTAAYMSPEQARGQIADRRADIWAFGVLVTEMLTAKRLFDGETISDTLAGVLRGDLDWSALPRETPARVRALLRRCLERDPRRRLRDIGEARITLDEVIRGVPDEAAAAPAATAPSRGAIWLPLAGAVLFGAMVAGVALRLTAAPSHSGVPLRKFFVEPDTSALVARAPTISPDGQRVACLIGSRLAIRDLARFESRSFPVEPGAQAPFWSPDGKSVGFFVGSRIVKLAANDGQQQVLSDTRKDFTGGTGGNWTARGTILFSRGDENGVLEISERGGDPHTVVPIDSLQETDFHEPFELPGGRGIVFVAHRVVGDTGNISLWSNGKRRVLLELPDLRVSSVHYSPTGHLVFRRAPNTPGVWAVPFSLAKLAVTGTPFLVAAEGSAPSVALDGTLCYLPGGSSASRQMVLLSRDGSEPRPIGASKSGAGIFLTLDPTGTRATRSESENGNTDLWIYDLARETRTRLTFDPGEDEGASWSPDGREIAYYSRAQNCTAANCWHVVRRAADGTGKPDTLAVGALPFYTPDGRDLVYTAFPRSGATWDLMRVPRDRSSPPSLLIQGNPYAVGGRVSPDGGYIAYMSNESERYEVYLTRYPSAEGRWQVSNSGGQWPHWSPKGDRLYFTQGDEIMEVEVSLAGSPTLGTPRRIVTRAPLGPQAFGFDMTFDVSPDGKQFLTTRNPGAVSRPPGLAIVQNWFSEFEAAK